MVEKEDRIMIIHGVSRGNATYGTILTCLKYGCCLAFLADIRWYGLSVIIFCWKLRRKKNNFKSMQIRYSLDTYPE